MLFSVFSHYSLFHFGANMIALYSISKFLVHIKSISDCEQFLAFYLSAGESQLIFSGNKVLNLLICKQILYILLKAFLLRSFRIA